MVSAIRFSGISSGLDTAAIVDQLMGVESLTQKSLQRRVSVEEGKQASLKTLNGAIAGLVTSAASFATGSTWQQLNATSTHASVTAHATAAAQPTDLSATVNSVATSAKVSFADATSLTAVVADSDSTLTVDLPDGTSTTVATGDGTLKTLVANLSALKGTDGQAVVNAATVKVSDGNFKLLLSSSSSGAGSLSLSGANLNLGAATSVAGSDAAVDLGAGITVTSRSNTFTDIVPGVSLTLAPGTAVGTVADVSVKADPSSRATGVNALVSQLNSVLNSMSSMTAHGTAGVGGGAWSGDSVLRMAPQQLLNTVYTGDGGVLNQIGVSIDRAGRFNFDSAVFEKAFAADPAGVQAAIAGAGGFAERVKDASLKLSGTQGLQTDGSVLATNGQLTQLLKQHQSTISSFNDQIAAWDERLERKRTSLESLYTRLETTMSRLSSQQSWLSAQLDSLSSSSSS